MIPQKRQMVLLVTSLFILSPPFTLSPSSSDVILAPSSMSASGRDGSGILCTCPSSYSDIGDRPFASVPYLD